MLFTIKIPKFSLLAYNPFPYLLIIVNTSLYFLFIVKANSIVLWLLFIFNESVKKIHIHLKKIVSWFVLLHFIIDKPLTYYDTLNYFSSILKIGTHPLLYLIYYQTIFKIYIYLRHFKNKYKLVVDFSMLLAP